VIGCASADAIGPTCWSPETSRRLAAKSFDCRPDGPVVALSRLHPAASTARAVAEAATHREIGLRPSIRTPDEIVVVSGFRILRRASGTANAGRRPRTVPDLRRCTHLDGSTARAVTRGVGAAVGVPSGTDC